MDKTTIKWIIQFRESFDWVSRRLKFDYQPTSEQALRNDPG
jgi:hypothetical protein